MRSAFPELDGCSARRRRALLNELAARTSGVEWVGFGAAALCIGSVSIATGLLMVHRGLHIGWFVAASVSTTVVVTPFVLWRMREFQRRVLRRMLTNEYCGSCGYSVAGLSRNHGSVICPECGSTSGEAA